MNTFFATLSIAAGLLMLVSPFRARMACCIGGLAAIFSGAFTLFLPLAEANVLLGWILFSFWIVSLPILAGCAPLLAIEAIREPKLLGVALAAGLALLSAIPPLISFLSAAASGVVDADESLLQSEPFVEPQVRLQRFLKV